MLTQHMAFAKLFIDLSRNYVAQGSVLARFIQACEQKGRNIHQWRGKTSPHIDEALPGREQAISRSPINLVRDQRSVLPAEEWRSQGSLSFQPLRKLYLLHNSGIIESGQDFSRTIYANIRVNFWWWFKYLGVNSG